jgi:CRP/FNR family transcriptional activator FtrB
MGPALGQSTKNKGEVPTIEAVLRAAPGFDQLDGPVLQQIAALGEIADIRQGETLFREGDMPVSLFVLLDGRVSLTGTAADSSSAVVDILGPNSTFILANALTDERYRMGAEAVVGSSLIRIEAAGMRAAVVAQPDAALAMMRAMSGELGAMTRQVVDLKVRIAAQRLGSYLLNMVGEPGAQQADFRLPVNKGLLASWLGCRAENLSRAFVALRAYGVETHGSRVQLHDVGRLRAYAGAPLREGDAMSQGDAAAGPTVEQVLGDAFRLRPNRPRGR